MAKAPIHVAVTGAAGQIAYSLVPSLCQGQVFGADQPIVLHLLDIAVMMEVLHGVVMELQDCSYPLLTRVVATADAEEAFRDCDVAVLVGAMPRREGMERKDLLAANAKIFKVQGHALDTVAKKSVKVLVVGNPANTNALITATYAPSIPKTQFTCLTMLDQNRAVAQLALRLGVGAAAVRNVIVWGNHSATQYPDVTHATVDQPGGAAPAPVTALVNDQAYLHGDFIRTVQVRGAAIIKARKLSSALSAAKAVCDHLRAWWCGTAPGEFVSMGVVSDGSAYDIPAGVVYSFPVTCRDGHVAVHRGLALDEFSKTKMAATLAELLEEREQAFAVCHPGRL